MLYQDTLTGALHEVPDGQVYESDFSEYPYQLGEPVFDGLGNPVGFLPFLPALASLAPKLMSTFAPKVSSLVSGFLRPPSPAAAAAAALPAAAAALPAAAAAIPAAAAAIPAAMSLLAARQMPPGWIRRPVPYTGAPGRRVYMNCRFYPGPRGLVPVSAAQAQPGLLPGPAGVPPPPAFRRRGRRRR